MAYLRPRGILSIPYPRVSGWLQSLDILSEIKIQSLFGHAAFGHSAGSCLSRERVYQLIVSFTESYDSFQIGHPRLPNRGLHLDFGVLQWSKLVDI